MKKREEGLVSVVIPCYNAALFIEDCLNGLLFQTYKKMEVIIVNDASTDHTQQLVEKWVENTKPFFKTIICNLPVNTGFLKTSADGPINAAATKHSWPDAQRRASDAAMRVLTRMCASRTRQRTKIISAFG